MGVNLDKLKKKYKEVKERAELGPYWLPKTGDNLIRILPPVGKMDDVFYKEGAVHFNVGQNNEMVICPANTPDRKGKTGSCPICDLVDELMNSGNSSDIKSAKQLKAKARFWMNIIDCSDRAKGPQVFSAGIMIFKEVLEYFNDPDYGDISDIEEGRDITVTKSGTGIDTEYSVRPRPKISPLKKEILKKAIDLSIWEKLMAPGVDEIEEILGTSEDGDKKKSKEKSESKSGSKKKEEEEEDEEEDDEEEDEEEETKNEKKGKGKKKEEDEDDEDEEDEDEEDEDEDDEEEEVDRKKKSTKKGR